MPLRPRAASSRRADTFPGARTRCGPTSTLSKAAPPGSSRRSTHFRREMRSGCVATTNPYAISWTLKQEDCSASRCDPLEPSFHRRVRRVGPRAGRSQTIGSSPASAICSRQTRSAYRGLHGNSLALELYICCKQSRAQPPPLPADAAPARRACERGVWMVSWLRPDEGHRPSFGHALPLADADG